MTWATREAADGARAVELVTFSRGSGATGRVWRYATSDTDVVLDGLTYRASTLQRGAILKSQASGKVTMAATLATGTPMVSEWDTVRGQGAVTVLRVHLTDAGAVDGTGSDQRRPVFVGTVAGLELDGPRTTVQCEGIGSALSQPVPRIPISRRCPWSVFSQRCGLDPADYTHTATVDAVGVVDLATPGAALLDGTPTVTLTVDGAQPLLFMTDPDLTYFDGGVLTIGDTRWHLASVDCSAWPEVVATLHEPVPASAVGDDATLVPGCSKTVSLCRDRFANVIHFGGFHRLPERNPLREGLV